ncbi:MAG: hypothetical protein LBQ42_10160, partial [Synergistaceae bacterium]|nr:hypothetical protein [Synergistaceae bacterium]
MSEAPHKWRDMAWKKALGDGARSAIEYFMPDLAADMDPLRDVAAISGMELPVIDSDTDKGMRVSDVFLSVPLLGGEDSNVALLLEQQHDPDESLPLKMLELYVRLRDKLRTKTTAIAIYTGSAKNVDTFKDSCYGVELSFKYNTFYLPEKDIDALRRDTRPFARVVLAGRLYLEAGDDVPSRERYAWEIWNTTNKQDYGARETRFILNFAGDIFQLRDPKISQKLKEAYKMKTIPLRDYVRNIDLETAKEEG